MIETIRKWNEINDYNFVLSEIKKNNKTALMCLCDTYSDKFYPLIFEIVKSRIKTDTLIYNFFLSIFNNPKNFEMTDGNVDVELFLINKLQRFIEKTYWK